jgi:hypothetical protein
MIIDRDGNLLEYWERKNGRAIRDSNNKYGIEFYICIPYSDEQKTLFSRKKELKKYLADSDFRALKYADGCYTEEEYKPYKEARAAARAEINAIEKEFIEPTLTREEMDRAEELAMNKFKA